MAKLEHPRCLRAFACGRDAEHVYIAYGYVPGRTFREALRAGKVKDADAIEVAAQVLDGLAHAHERGNRPSRREAGERVARRRDEGVSVRILDFGLARFAEARPSPPPATCRERSRTSRPSACTGARRAAGDVWSVGVLL